MTFAEQNLIVAGIKYATPELAARAKRQQEASEQAAQERKAKLAEVWEAELRERFLATPGATEEDWARQRESIVGKAREAATLERADVTREINRARYGG